WSSAAAVPNRAGKWPRPRRTFSVSRSMDIYTEPTTIDPVTLRNLGPLIGIAGVWEGNLSLDVNPKAAATEQQVFVERIELQPIDPQTNGPQLRPNPLACREQKI